jgi:hypothetical protein
LEHRAGIEPANTGFADAPEPLFSCTYVNYTTLKNPEKYAKESSQWCYSGVVSRLAVRRVDQSKRSLSGPTDALRRYLLNARIGLFSSIENAGVRIASVVCE